MTTKDFVQSRLLSWCQTKNPVVDGLISAFIISIIACLSSRFYIYKDRFVDFLSELDLFHRKENSIEIEEHSRYGQCETYLDFCWFITHERPCKKGSLRATEYIKYDYNDEGDSEVQNKMAFFIPREDIYHDFQFQDQRIRYKFWKITRESQNDKRGVTLYHTGPTCELLYEFIKYIEKARKDWIASHAWTQTVFTNKGDEWVGIPSHNSKSMNTVVMSGGIRQDIEQDLERFLSSEDWYKQMGIPFTRGFLLHGPPGCGKTSIIKAISYKLKMDIYNFNLSIIKDDDMLKSLFDKVPIKSMVVFEDIDCMNDVALARSASTVGMSDSDDDDDLEDIKTDDMSKVLGPQPKKNTITLSCLLNAFDGLTPQHGRVLVITTNHPQKLDPALTRPGRIDMVVALGMCDTDIVDKFYNLYYRADLPEDVKQMLNESARKLNKLSPADVSSIFLKFRSDPHLGLNELASKLE